MNDLPLVRRALRILIEPGWAPFSVVVLHAVLAQFGLTERFDHLVHFLGGASIAYFFYRLLTVFSLFPAGQRWAVYVLAFTSSCATAAFWELVEFASDIFLRTTVQRSVSETMLDLLFGILGATTTVLIALVTRISRRNG